MIITFYDKDFNPLQDNASLNVGEWNLTRRAVDYDDFTAISEPFLEEINPTFVVLKDDFGRYKYAAFAGIPELTKDNQTSLQASDFKTIFNCDIITSFSTGFTYLYDYFDEVMNDFVGQVLQGSFTVELDTRSILDVEISDLGPIEKTECLNIWEDCIKPYLKYYDLYLESKLDIKNKKIIFTIKKCNHKYMPLRLWEYNIRNYGKYITSINEVQALVLYTPGQDRYYGYQWILKSDNSITTNPNQRDLYPIKRKVIFIETDDNSQANINTLLNDGNIEALQTLVEARYQESFTINIDNDQRYDGIDFDTSFRIYAKQGVLYKILPLGEIIEDSKGKKTLKIGYKPEDIIYYI